MHEWAFTPEMKKIYSQTHFMQIVYKKWLHNR